MVAHSMRTNRWSVRLIRLIILALASLSAFHQGVLFINNLIEERVHHRID